MCVLSFICYPTTCGPKGHGSGGDDLIYDHIFLAGLTGHSWVSPEKRNFACKQIKTKQKKEQNRRKNKGKRFILRKSPAPPPLPHCSPPPPPPPGAFASLSYTRPWCLTETPTRRPSLPPPTGVWPKGPAGVSTRNPSLYASTSSIFEGPTPRTWRRSNFLSSTHHC